MSVPGADREVGSRAPHVPIPLGWTTRYRQVREGVAPAEVLPQTLRHRLLRELREDGLSVREIAALTMTTEYTVVRILNMEEP